MINQRTTRPLWDAPRPAHVNRLGLTSVRYCERFEGRKVSSVPSYRRSHPLPSHFDSSQPFVSRTAAIGIATARFPNP
jgi:hypothetical protein